MGCHYVRLWSTSVLSYLSIDPSISLSQRTSPITSFFVQKINICNLKFPYLSVSNYNGEEKHWTKDLYTNYVDGRNVHLTYTTFSQNMDQSTRKLSKITTKSIPTKDLKLRSYKTKISYDEIETDSVSNVFFRPPKFSSVYIYWKYNYFISIKSTYIDSSTPEVNNHADVSTAEDYLKYHQWP